MFCFSALLEAKGGKEIVLTKNCFSEVLVYYSATPHSATPIFHSSFQSDTMLQRHKSCHNHRNTGKKTTHAKMKKRKKRLNSKR